MSELNKLPDIALRMIKDTNLETRDNKILVMAGNLAKALNTFKSILVLYENKLHEDMHELTRILFEQMITIRFLLEIAEDEDLNAYIDYEAIIRFNAFCRCFDYEPNILLNMDVQTINKLINKNKSIKNQTKSLEIVLNAIGIIAKYGKGYKRHWHREDDLGKLIIKTDKKEMWYYENLYSNFSSKTHSDISSIAYFFKLDDRSRLSISLEATSRRPEYILNVSAYFFIKILILYQGEILNIPEYEELKDVREYLINEYRKGY